MIYKVTWRQYVAWLQSVEGFSEDEARSIALEQYRKQWGQTPKNHEEQIKRLWEIETTKPNYKVRKLSQ